MNSHTKGMSKVLKGAGMLAICALIAKMIGALYRIPLTNIVGSEGIGLYQMIFPLYTVLLTVSSGGLPVAISRVVSERTAKGDWHGARRILLVSLVSLTIAGAVAAAVLVLFRKPIASCQGNPLASLPYLGIAPSLIFVAMIACFRGYYQGKQNMLPSALSQLVEQVVKLAAGLFLASKMLPYGVEYGVLGALLGVSASEAVTLIYLASRYLIGSLRYNRRVRVPIGTGAEIAQDMAMVTATTPPKTRTLLAEIYRVAIPVTLGSLVMPLTQVIDSILVINLLVAKGTALSSATSAFGLLAGPVGTILNMPVVVTLSFAVALLPKVAECFTKKESMADEVGQSLRFNWIIGLFCTLFLAVFALPIVKSLYQKGLTQQEQFMGASLIQVGSLSVVFVSLLQVATSVLQGTNQAHKPAVNLLCGAVVKVILTLVLLPSLGLLGAMASSVACYGVTCVLDVRDMCKTVRPVLKKRAFLLGTLSAGTAFCLVGIVLEKLLATVLPPLWTVLCAMTGATLAFVVLLFAFRSIKMEELKELLTPKKRRRNG